MTKLFSQRDPGFTLLELMLAVALISLLMVIAVPGYTSYVDRARVGTAIAALGAHVGAGRALYLLDFLLR